MLDVLRRQILMMMHMDTMMQISSDSLSYVRDANVEHAQHNSLCTDKYKSKQKHTNTVTQAFMILKTTI